MTSCCNSNIFIAKTSLSVPHNAISLIKRSYQMSFIGLICCGPILHFWSMCFSNNCYCVNYYDCPIFLAHVHL